MLRTITLFYPCLHTLFFFFGCLPIELYLFIYLFILQKVLAHFHILNHHPLSACWLWDGTLGLINLKHAGNNFFNVHILLAKESRCIKSHNFRLLGTVVCVHAKSLQSHSTLRNPMDCSPSGASLHGILQTKILDWVAMPSSRASSLPRDEPTSPVAPALAGGFFTTSATWEAHGYLC